jgi:predicted acylesterase/phospholipase RssA
MEEIEKIQEIEIQENENVSSEYDTIVLGGGALKSFNTMGALQYVYDSYLINNNSLKTFIGTSGGSMIAYLLIIGYTPVDIMVFLCTNQIFEKLQNFNMVALMNGLGAVSYLHIYEQLEKMTIEKIGYIPTFKDIKENFNKDFIAITYNITEDKIEYLSHDTYPNLPCLIAIRMSSNLPLIFDHFKYGNSYYIDGGMANNFAIDIGIQKGKKVLGIYTEMSNYSFTKNTEFNLSDYILKIMFIPSREIINLRFKSIDKNIHKINIIKLNDEKNSNPFNFGMSVKDRLDLFSNGYQIAKNYNEMK